MHVRSTCSQCDSVARRPCILGPYGVEMHAPAFKMEGAVVGRRVHLSPPAPSRQAVGGPTTGLAHPHASPQATGTSVAYRASGSLSASAQLHVDSHAFMGRTLSSRLPSPSAAEVFGCCRGRKDTRCRGSLGEAAHCPTRQVQGACHGSRWARGWRSSRCGRVNHYDSRPLHYWHGRAKDSRCIPR